MEIKQLYMRRLKSHSRSLRVTSQRVREAQAQQSNWNQPISQRVRETQAQQSNWNQPISQRMKRLYWKQVTVGSTHVGENQVHQEEVATVAGRQQGWQQQQNRNTNPIGSGGKILTCRYCGSFRHLVAKCPHNRETSNISEKMAKVNIAEDEHAVLFTGYNKGEISQLGTDARNCAVLDSACSSTVCGEMWLDNYLNSLSDGDRKRVRKNVGHKTFKFGGGERLQSKGEYSLPGIIAGKEVTIKTDVVHSDIPLLLSRDAMKTAGVKMDLENDTANIFGKDVALNLTNSGHYCIPIDKAEKITVAEVFSSQLEEMDSKDK